ncbi:uncharacterized protein LOC124456015 isoform X1 [Xenia sp. Carnegie-2017]|uniref:uncharacterized protein LOC124456015 isoform X1 n=2 Tax=Xenia sp. Carnegie-2017 TaxID=2897299 RepID=UPI001F045BC5|nr:uncharacterized protein LOC124456015 isoform X1 [Xenia sp. Carnegie-2017]
MRDLKKRLSQSIEHLHDLMFDRNEVDSVPSGADYTGVIYREGYLFKQSRRMRRYWKTRYFVLRSDGLLYYRSNLEKDNVPLGVIPLTRLSVHVDCMDNKGKPKYCLRLSGKHLKTFILCCFASDERNCWLTALLTAISEDIVSTFTLRKYRDERCSSVSSTDSGIWEGPSTPRGPSPRNKTLLNINRHSAMKRTGSCDINVLYHQRQLSREKYLMRRPSRSLGSLAQLNELRELDVSVTNDKRAVNAPKKTRKPSRFWKSKTRSSDEMTNWQSSYIDLSCIA